MEDLLRFSFLSIPLIGAFAIFALGIVVIYRASRVLNLAHGAMAILPAYLHYTMVEVLGFPPVAALPLSIASGALLGILVELVFVRRLRPQGPTAQTVGTVAVTGLTIALVSRVWGTTPIRGQAIFPEGELEIVGSIVGFGDIGLFLVGLTVSGAMLGFFQYTEIGLAMRGAAQNRTAASLMGIDPDRAASAAWAIGGGAAGLAGVLLSSVSTFDPFTLSLQVLPAFVAALIGGLGSLIGAMSGAIVVGLTFGLVPMLTKLPAIGGLFANSGAPQLVLTVVALIAMATRGRRVVGVEAADAGLTSGQTLTLGQGGVGPGSLLAVIALAFVPFVVPFSVLGSTLLAFEFAIVAISLVILTGWVGQISLAQATFVGVGALVSAIAARDLGIGFPASAVLGVVAAGAAAVLLGAVALRVRGLYLAVATLIFAWMGESFLFRSPWLGASGGSSTIPNQYLGTPGTFPAFDFTSRRVLYFVLLAALAIVLAAMSNLRSTRTGRAFFALRGSEMAAASLGIDVTRYKLVAFGIAGALAGLGGTLLMLEQRTVVPEQFFVTASLQFLAIAVVGGLTSLAGAVSAGVMFAALNELFFRVEALGGWLDVVSASLLAIVLLAYPGGLAAVPETFARIRERMRRPALFDAIEPRLAFAGVPAEAENEDEPAERRAPSLLARVPFVADFLDGRRERSPTVGAPVRVPDRPEDWFDELVSSPDATPQNPAPTSSGEDGQGTTPDRSQEADETNPLRIGRVAPPLPEDRSQRRALVEARDVTVRFGGLTAVDDATLTVREGEIVGLIGPNGAGKTTLFNAILGLNDPAEGTVHLYGHDVTTMPPHLRVRFGVARTFQVLQLFNELTVADNLLVATHLHNRSSLAGNLVASGRTIQEERRARRRVQRVLELLSLQDIADESVRNLPFGVLRMVELARALVTGAKVMMLDEAASGLNDSETERLVQVVRAVRDLGVSVLLIEHDVKMVTGVSDYVYVLDQGKMIAHGRPAEVRRDPKVIAAYIGGTVDDAEPEAQDLRIVEERDRDADLAGIASGPGEVS